MTDIIAKYYFIALDNCYTLPRTRADLMQHPAFAGLETDTQGNPCVWLNEYADEAGNVWDSYWSCQCDDDGVSPYASHWSATCAPNQSDQAYRLWERLPEKGDKEGEAAYLAELETMKKKRQSALRAQGDEFFKKIGLDNAFG